jgi:hypothetical protein|uniref:Uncharacterized protein n=1 Tax=viral metagenome TaxID=1070528 RepID=A0A6C0EN43_9ZZZZ
MARRKCPPGVICIENVTITFLICALGLIGLFFYYSGFSPNQSTVIVNRDIISQGNEAFPRWNVTNTDAPRDVLMNPYSPPLKLDRFMPPVRTAIDPRGVPINVRTQGFDDAYRQVGLLTRLNGKETILPLMGRPLHTNRNKWQYYTISDQHQGIKLPVSRNGRSCTNEYGCDDLYNGDTIYVEGYKDAFKVTTYENALPRYIPYL